MYTSIYTHTHPDISIHMYIPVHTLYTCIHLYTPIDMPIHVYTSVYTHTHP